MKDSRVLKNKHDCLWFKPFFFWIIKQVCQAFCDGYCKTDNDSCTSACKMGKDIILINSKFVGLFVAAEL